MGTRSITMVTVPVRDQDRALRFYVDALDFRVAHDYVMDAATAGAAGAGARWLMLSPPGGGADVLLSTWSSVGGTVQLSLTCDDIDATFAGLRAAGVVDGDEVQDAPWGRWFGVHDPDGNGWLVVEPR